MPELHSAHATLKQYLVPIESVRQHPANPREADEDVLRESLILNGQYSPCVAQASTGFLLMGNGTYAAALSLGWTHLAVVMLDVDDDKALRYLLADNRVHQYGGTDPAALLALLRELDGEFSGSGYTASDFSELVSLFDDLAGDIEPVSSTAISGDLRSLVLTYEQAEFDRLVGWLMALRSEEGETFTEVIVGLVGEALAARS